MTATQVGAQDWAKSGPISALSELGAPPGTTEVVVELLSMGKVGFWQAYANTFL
jgi:hypothetical protein